MPRPISAALALLLLIAPVAALAGEPPRTSTTLDVTAPLLLGALMNTYGSFLEHQVAVSEHFSLIGEVTYLASPNFRRLGGDLTGLTMRLAILCFGVNAWLHRPFEGPFASLRVEGWFSAAQDADGTAAIGNQFDINFQPGWQWLFGRFTLIAGVSIAYVTGPVRSADGTVEFPLAGFSATPHVRAGVAF